MLVLEHLLLPFGFTSEAPTKLVRHQDARFDIDMLLRAGQFDFYQSFQSRPVFDGCSQIISFIGHGGTHAKFVGVYRVDNVLGPHNVEKPKSFLYPQMDTTNHYQYMLTPDRRFQDLAGRLIIDWGAGTRSWVQHFKPNTKAVIEVLPRGYVQEFPGFLDFTLTFDDLQGIINHPVAHREWHRMLASVSGIYIILDNQTGRQYIGSAYGAGGILSRWSNYARTGHGGNDQLKNLLTERPSAKSDLSFSVLQTLPLTLTSKEVIAFENLHKRKLGSRAHGLNSN